MPELKVELISKSDKKDIQYFLDKRLLKIFLGEKNKLNLDKIRAKVSEVDWKQYAEEQITLSATGLDDAQLEAAYETMALKSYQFDKYKTKDAREKIKTKVKKISFKKEKPKFTTKRDVIIDAVKYARDIVNSNASEINPGAMERFAKAIAKSSTQIKVKVIDAKEAKKLGMGCLLAVGAESIKNSEADFHPRLVVLEYTGAQYKSASARHTALVGKGITFDTGGLCLKPNNYMLDMKSDMAGSATVLSIFKALASLSKSAATKKSLENQKITGVLCLAENAFGASSYKPGDVLKAMNGKTVQVVDTDAEGRLVLADGLAYTSQLTEQPNQIIDYATLTGSIVSALGEVAAGAMANDDALFNKLRESFATEGEKIWRMPIFDEYKKGVESEIADLAHCGARPDASIAAIFLKEFVANIIPAKSKNTPGKSKQIPWVHLDIAGMGFIENDGLFAYKGATGFAVKGTLAYLLAS